MALRFCDGCDAYTTAADLSYKYGVVGAQFDVNATAGRTGAGAIVMNSGTASGLDIRHNTLNLASTAPLVTGFWFKASGLPAAIKLFYEPYTTGNHVQNCYLNTNGCFVLTAVNTSTIIATGTRNVCDGSWHWIEVYTSTSTNTCYVDGVFEWSQSNGTAPGGTLDWVRFTSIPGLTCYLDDIIVYDASGSGMVTGSFPYGPRQIATVRPSGDDSVQFTRSSGATNYSLVNEVTLDTTSYVQSGTSGNQDTYDYTDLSFTPTQISGVAVNSFVQNPSAGTVNFQSVAKSSATIATGTSNVSPASVSMFQDVFDLDPNTSAAWTPAGFNAAKFGIKVV